MRKCLGLVVLAALVAGQAAAREDEKLKPMPLPMNTEDDDDEPHVAEGGLLFLFTRVKGGKEVLLAARRKVASGAWPKKAIDEGDFDYVAKKGDVRGVFATAGTHPRYLYFAAKDKLGKNYDLFVAVQQDTRKAWTAPTFLIKGNTDEDEAHPSLSADGKSLYFSRRTKEGWQQMVMTRAAAKGPQGWREPEEVGLPVGFHHAAVTPDGKTMYLQGPLDKERWGLFFAQRKGKGWDKPVPLDKLNDAEGKVGDKSPSLSRDGKVLYFSSDRPGGKGGLDLYAITREKLGTK